MNYIGSKLSLLDFLDTSIGKVATDDCKVFCDLFAGTGIVGRHFKKRGFKVIANDIQYYSYVLNRHYIGNHRAINFEKLASNLSIKKNGQTPIESVFDYLQNLRGKKGFIYKNYCKGGTQAGDEERMYFSDSNGMKCDAIRQQIEEWKKLDILSNDEYYFLLASLLESIDKYANTASIYGAFLKNLKKSAQANLVLKPAELIENEQSHTVYNQDVNQVIKNINTDILYLDPPYNARQYAANYHLLETIALYDAPKIQGKTGLRNYEHQKSRYCSKPQAVKAFNDLISNANAKYIFLSYNNEGLMDFDDIKTVMQSRGHYGYLSQSYNRFKADRTENRQYKSDSTLEYLHYVVCNSV